MKIARSTPKILMFGKYKGVEVEQVISCEPQYIQWCLYNIEGFSLSERHKKLLEHCLSDFQYDDEFDYWQEHDLL